MTVKLLYHEAIVLHIKRQQHQALSPGSSPVLHVICVAQNTLQLHSRLRYPRWLHLPCTIAQSGVSDPATSIAYDDHLPKDFSRQTMCPMHLDRWLRGQTSQLYLIHSSVVIAACMICRFQEPLTYHVQCKFPATEAQLDKFHRLHQYSNAGATGQHMQGSSRAYPVSRMFC